MYMLFPENCASCGKALLKGEEGICTSCVFSLPLTNFHQNSNNTIALLFAGRVKIEQASSYLWFTKGGNVQNLLHQIKYNNRKEVAFTLGRLYGLEFSRQGFFAGIELIVPVPLHPSRQQKRGYNQSEWFAKGIAEVLKIPVEADLLVRIRHNATQTHKSRQERWKNVSEVFAVRSPSELCDKHILLVDDVVTTGATLEACAQQLLKIPGTKVSVATLAYAEI